MENSHIEWTDHTFNPWIGCQRVSPGCVNCYAETRDNRFHGGDHWGPRGTREVTSDANWRKPISWNKKAEAAGVAAKVFCASLADVFEDRPELDAPRARLFCLIQETPWLIWQLLTKRPENVMRMVPENWQARLPSNIWIGTSVEDQRRADERIPHLLRIPADVRFLSCEPLLGPVNLHGYVSLNGKCFNSAGYTDSVQWVIVGGESGVNARPMHPSWLRSLRDQCSGTRVPFFFKQWGEWAPAHLRAGGDLGGDMRRGHTRILHAPGNPDGHFRPGDVYVSRLGKHASGRELDGRAWDELPKAAAVLR